MKVAPLGREATLEDLYRVEGNAELVDGVLVLMPPGGDFHGTAATSISTSLKNHQRAHGGGRAYADGTGYVYSPRRSFAPDASWYVGPRSGTKLLEGAPRFAAEVRSEDDYGPAAEREMAAKRAAYFAAGTLVVWDVDVLREELVRVYRADAPESPTVYRRGEVAEAEPAVPGWRMPVEELFD
ncbi:MAG TPA: Uma2 family endonuclease [Longimicrobium sp.]|nr:Uma2 family endonuclease [Longimicrobium sp.]